MRRVVSYQDLRSFHRNTLDELADAWREQAKNLTDRAESVGEQVTALASWEGTAASEAREGLKQIKTQLSDAADEIAEVPPALSAAADEISDAKRQLEAAVTKGEGVVQVSDSGEVSAVPAGSREMNADEIKEREEKLSEVREGIEAALRKATTADEDASATLNGIRPAEIGIDAGAGVGRLPKIPSGDPAQIAKWWQKLSPMERESLLFTDSAKIGNLDGIPIEVRDRANRFALDEHRAIMETKIDEYARTGDENSPYGKKMQDKLDGINKISDYLGKHDGKPDAQRVYLIGFDAQHMSKNGEAIVSIGNPDTADNVSTHVPGTTSRLAASGSRIGEMNAMYGAMNDADPNAENAAITWIGYDAPQDIATEATSEKYIPDAAEDLTRFQDGLRETHQGGDAHHTVMGHSYGSTVIGHALHPDQPDQPSLQADKVVLVGSPGTGTEHVSELEIDQDKVWSTTAENDFIEAVPSPHGKEPTDPSFGAREFASAPGDAHVPNLGREVHSEYWRPSNAGGLESMGEIATDNEERVREINEDERVSTPPQDDPPALYDTPPRPDEPPRYGNYS